MVTVAPAASSTTRSSASASSSSSMARTRTPRKSPSRVSGASDSVRGCSRRSPISCGCTIISGSLTLNVAPLPSPSLDASTEPPCISTMCRTIDEAEPEPAGLARGARLPPGGTARTRAGRNSAGMPMPVSLTTISTCEFDALQPHLDAALLRRELDRVRQQVPDHLLQSIRVARDRADARIDDGLDAHALRVGRRLHRRDRVVDDQRAARPAARRAGSCRR